MTDENSAKTVAIIGAGIGGLYLIAELGVAGFKLRLHDIDDRSSLKFERAAVWMSKARMVSSLRLSARRAISDPQSTAPMSSSS